MKRLKSRIERKLGIVFGAAYLVPDNPDDFAFILRLGLGKNRQWINFELGVFGYTIYFGRVGWRAVDAKARADFKPNWIEPKRVYDALGIS